MFWEAKSGLKLVQFGPQEDWGYLIGRERHPTSISLKAFLNFQIVSTIFQCLDSDDDGKLSFEDISNSLKKYFGGNEESFQISWHSTFRFKDFHSRRGLAARRPLGAASYWSLTVTHNLENENLGIMIVYSHLRSYTFNQRSFLSNLKTFISLPIEEFGTVKLSAMSHPMKTNHFWVKNSLQTFLTNIPNMHFYMNSLRWILLTETKLGTKEKNTVIQSINSSLALHVAASHWLLK